MLDVWIVAKNLPGLCETAHRQEILTAATILPIAVDTGIGGAGGGEGNGTKGLAAVLKGASEGPVSVGSVTMSRAECHPDGRLPHHNFMSDRRSCKAVSRTSQTCKRRVIVVFKLRQSGYHGCAFHWNAEAVTT